MGGAPECRNRSEAWSFTGNEAACFGLVHGDIGVIVVAVCLVPFEFKWEPRHWCLRDSLNMWFRCGNLWC